MGRKRRGQIVNGWIIVDKPAGMTSAHVVAQVKRMLDAAKIGHGGTLDPLATGVLPLALGEATKTVSYVMDGEKTYRFTAKWGEARDTDDSDGRVTETSSVRPDRNAIEAALPAFRGEISQIPPDYSAIKVAGARAYDLAREGEKLDLAPRIARIDRFALLSQPEPDTAIFEVVCGKGTYMRSLARDLARALGTVGHITQLRRTKSGPFTENGAISLEKLEELSNSAPAAELVRPVETALDDIPALALTAEEARRLQSGQTISALTVARRTPLTNIGLGTVFCAMAEGKPVALARLEGGELRPIRVLNL